MQVDGRTYMVRCGPRADSNQKNMARTIRIGAEKYPAPLKNISIDKQIIETLAMRRFVSRAA